MISHLSIILNFYKLCYHDRLMTTTMMVMKSVVIPKTLLLGNLEELHRQHTKEREQTKIQVEDLKQRCQEKQELVENEHTSFMDFKEKTAQASVNSRSGKPIPLKVSMNDW